MKKNSGGLLALLTGVTLGAAAAFFSKKENRDKAQKAVRKVANDPRTKVALAKSKKTAKVAISKGKKIVKKAVAKAKKK